MFLFCRSAGQNIAWGLFGGDLEDWVFKHFDWETGYYKHSNWGTGYYKHFNWRTGYSNILIGDWVLQTYQFVFVLFVTTMRYEMLYNECGQAPIENESSVHCSD